MYEIVYREMHRNGRFRFANIKPRPREVSGSIPTVDFLQRQPGCHNLFYGDQNPQSWRETLDIEKHHMNTITTSKTRPENRVSVLDKLQVVSSNIKMIQNNPTSELRFSNFELVSLIFVCLKRPEYLNISCELQCVCDQSGLSLNSPVASFRPLRLHHIDSPVGGRPGRRENYMNLQVPRTIAVCNGQQAATLLLPESDCMSVYEKKPIFHLIYCLTKHISNEFQCSTMFIW